MRRIQFQKDIRDSVSRASRNSGFQFGTHSLDEISASCVCVSGFSCHPKHYLKRGSTYEFNGLTLGEVCKRMHYRRENTVVAHVPIHSKRIYGRFSYFWFEDTKSGIWYYLKFVWPDKSNILDENN